LAVPPQNRRDEKDQLQLLRQRIEFEKGNPELVEPQAVKVSEEKVVLHFQEPGGIVTCLVVALPRSGYDWCTGKVLPTSIIILKYGMTLPVMKPSQAMLKPRPVSTMTRSRLSLIVCYCISLTPTCRIKGGLSEKNIPDAAEVRSRAA